MRRAAGGYDAVRAASRQIIRFSRSGVAKVSTSTALAEGETGASAQQSTPKHTEPFHNPSYPQRVHFHERPQLEEIVRSWDAKIEELSQTLAQPSSNQGQEDRHRLYHQMLAPATSSLLPPGECLLRPLPCTMKITNSFAWPRRRWAGSSNSGHVRRRRAAQDLHVRKPPGR